jgi:hypothetical protein
VLSLRRLLLVTRAAALLVAVHQVPVRALVLAPWFLVWRVDQDSVTLLHEVTV